MAGVWNPAEMKPIPNPGCLSYFKAKAPDDFMRDNLFVYRHMRTKKFLLARWISETVFLPILELGDDLQLDDDIVTNYLHYCHPQSAPSLAKGLKQARDNHIALEEEHEREARETRAQILRDEFGIKVPDTDGRVYLPVGLVGS